MSDIVPKSATDVSFFKTEAQALMKATLAKDLTDDEFKWFMFASSKLGLNPLAREIYPLVFKSKKDGSRRVVFHVSIDALIAYAESTKKFQGWTPIELTVKNRNEKENQKPYAIPLKLFDSSTQKIISATIGIRHKDDPEPTEFTCQFKDYKPEWGGSNTGWSDDTPLKIIKCTQAHAIRRRFGLPINTCTREEYENELPAFDITFSSIPDETSPDKPRLMPDAPQETSGQPWNEDKFNVFQKQIYDQIITWNLSKQGREEAINNLCSAYEAKDLPGIPQTEYENAWEYFNKETKEMLQQENFMALPRNK